MLFINIRFEETHYKSPHVVTPSSMFFNPYDVLKAPLACYTREPMIDIKRISFFKNCRNPMLVVHVTLFSLNHKHNYSPVQFYSQLHKITLVNAAAEKKSRKNILKSNLGLLYSVQALANASTK
jgi:hypothetical protein